MTREGIAKQLGAALGIAVAALLLVPAANIWAEEELPLGLPVPTDPPVDQEEETELDELIESLDPLPLEAADPLSAEATAMAEAAVATEEPLSESTEASESSLPIIPIPIDPGPVPVGYPTGGPGAPTRLIRIAPADYWDGISELAGQDRLSPREISNIVIEQTQMVPSGKNASDLVWQWGQFVDHDIDLTEPVEPHEEANIPVPLGDPFFDPLGQGDKFIPFNRSIYDPTTGTSPSNPRQQLNEISALIDGTNVYGQDPYRTLVLRELWPNRGRLKTSPGDFLPYNVYGLPNAPDPNDPSFFLAGDIRANETVFLSAMHTLWMREHNRIADGFGWIFPWLHGNKIFNLSRRLVIAEMQVITYQEFLPMLLGANAIPPYQGYNPAVDPGIANEFSSAMFRLGHTMLSSVVLRLTAQGYPIPEGPLALRDAFFQPDRLIDEGGLEPIMKGMASQVMQRIDNMVVDDVRNFLFGMPGAGGLDLPSLNIQRARDHGLPDYNTFRIHYGLTPKASFAEISSNPEVQARLAEAYDSVDNIDPWVGALSEDPYTNDSLVGELLYTALREQYLRLRDGDRAWYQNIFSPISQWLLERTTLAKVITRNTDLRRRELQRYVMVAP